MEKGIIENIYLDNSLMLNKKEKFSKAFFIIKGKNIDQVKTILDEMPVSRARIAKYSLYPVGIKWLKHNKKAIQQAKKSKNTFVVVWNPIQYNEEYEAFLGEQNLQLMKLWNEGVIRNYE